MLWQTAYRQDKVPEAWECGIHVVDPFLQILKMHLVELNISKLFRIHRGEWRGNSTTNVKQSALNLVTHKHTQTRSGSGETQVGKYNEQMHTYSYIFHISHIHPTQFGKHQMVSSKKTDVTLFASNVCKLRNEFRMTSTELNRNTWMRTSKQREEEWIVVTRMLR